MRYTAIAAFAIAALLGSSQANASLRDRIRERMAERMQQDAQDAPAVPRPETLAYGSDPLQTLDFWPAKLPADPAMRRPALIVFVHGGGWKRGDKSTATGGWKVSHFTGEGYALASINYRLVPQATVEQQAGDVASAVKALIARAGSLGFDPHRIVLMGHSAGAHLVALVGTDERYLKSAGLSFADIAGVIPIDGAAYDVPRQMQEGNGMMQSTYREAFGTDPARQRALSPALQAAAPNAPHFLLLHVQRPDGVSQAKELEAALKRAGTQVERDGFPGTGLQGHMTINKRLGDPAYVATPVVDGWLKQVFAGPA